MVKIKIDLERCTGCGTCVDVCPMGVFEIENEKSTVGNADDCIICMACVTQCPNEAIEVIE